MERVSFGLAGTFDNGFDWNFDMTRSAEDNYGRQPDTGTSKLAAAIDGRGGPSGNETFDLFDPTVKLSPGVVRQSSEGSATCAVHRLC